MENFTEMFVESKGLKANTEVILDVKKHSSRTIPLRLKVIDSVFDTSEAAELVLSGYYQLSHNYEDYFISPEDVAKVAGLGDLIKKGGGKVKIGRKTFNFGPSTYYGEFHGQTIKTKAYRLEIQGGEAVDKVVPNKLPTKVKKMIKSGPVIYALKSKLTQEQVDGIYSTHNEDFKMGFYVRDNKDGIDILLMSSFELTKGESFYIYGDQHTSKNEKFTFVDLENPNIRYVKLSKRQVSVPRSYSKGLVRNRADGFFVAK